MVIKGYKWPAPYRDTSVLIDARAVKTKDIEQLARLNRWCSYIIYSDKKHQKKTDIFGYGEDIKGDMLTNISTEWEGEIVHRMMTAYVRQIPALTNKKKLTDLWLQSGTYLRNHLNKTTSSKMKEAEKFKRHMEITAWITLLEFFQKNCEVSSQTVEDFKVSLLEVLLPGCTLQKADNTPIPQAARSPQNEFEDMLRKLLTQENLERFFPLPDKHGVVWLDRTLDSDMAIWGYIKYYAWSEGEAKIPCLVLLREQLLSTVDELGLRRSSFSDVLTAFQNKKPSYMHETLNAKVRKKQGERATSITAYRLKISELPIEQSIIQALTDKATK